MRIADWRERKPKQLDHYRYSDPHRERLEPIDTTEQVHQPQLSGPQHVIHCDIPASLRVMYIVITTVEGDHLSTHKFMDDAIMWLKEHDVSEAWLKTQHYQCRISILSTITELDATIA